MEQELTQKLTLIFERKGTTSLNISEFNTFNDQLFDESIRDCNFTQIIFVNVKFQECEISSSIFSNCLFQNCIFTNTKIQKSTIFDCKFDNSQFINSSLTPKVEFFRTLFENSEFSNVDFTSIFLFQCKFQNIILTKINFKGSSVVDLKTTNLRFCGLKFDEDKPLKLAKSEKDFKMSKYIKINDPLTFRKEFIN